LQEKENQKVRIRCEFPMHKMGLCTEILVENRRSYPIRIRTSGFILLDLEENEFDEGIGLLIPENEASSKK
jgi:hypothetical protein